MRERFDTVDAYIAAFPPETRTVLEEARRRLLAVVPDSGERISYNIPTITTGGRIAVHFAAFATHLGVYPLPREEALRAELAPHVHGKGTARYPLDRPIPWDLIERTARALAAERRGA